MEESLKKEIIKSEVEGSESENGGSVEVKEEDDDEYG